MHVGVQSSGHESACNSYDLRARSGHRTADFSGDCPKIDTLAAQRSDGVMEPNTLLVGDENAPVFADSRDRNRLLTQFESERI
jgi:hypothetical protein